MKVKSLNKKNVVEFVTANNRVLISYETPVACINRYSKAAYKTNKLWSITTTRHINQWLSENGYNPDDVESIDQSYFQLEDM